MKKDIPQEDLIIRKNRWKRVWQRVVMAMACMVVFFTTYALILPAITMEHSCSLEEHAHGEGCYENDALVCVMEEHCHDIHCEGTKETEALTEMESAQVEETQAETTSATENPETTAAAESAETVPMETAVTEIVPQETQAGDMVMEGSGQEGTLFVYDPMERVENGYGELQSRKRICGQEASDTHTHSAEECYEASVLTWEVTRNTMTDKCTLTIRGEGEIPDYASYANRPWNAYAGKIDRVILDDTVTRIGDYAFVSIKIKEIEWSGVESVGQRAFWGCGLTSFTIPDSVLKIEVYAFQDNTFSNGLDLGKGVKVIEPGAFPSLNGIDVTIPASVISIGQDAFGSAQSIKVDENNRNYSSEDGVLFDKEKTTLIEYPRCLQEYSEYKIPASVKEIKKGAFSDVYYLNKLTIPNTVEIFPTYLIANSKIMEIEFEDGTKFNTTEKWFEGAVSLNRIRLPENTPLKIDIQWFSGYGTWPYLDNIVFPNGLTYLGRFGNQISLPGLQSVTYNAQNAEIADVDILGTDSSFDVTIGSDVDQLPATFSYFSERATDFYFSAGNAFVAEKGAFDGADSPIEGLSGTLYVDENGVLYAYDAAESTAALVYCSPNVDSVTVPESIEPETGVKCNVVRVCKDALMHARTLESIGFEKPEQVTLEDHALANCPTLTHVNEMGTVAEAEATFVEAQIGGGVFYNTGLAGSDRVVSFGEHMAGLKSLTVTQNGASDMTITVGAEDRWEGDEKGGYHFLIGERPSIAISSGYQSPWVYRVYFQFTGRDGKLGKTIGDETIEGQTFHFYETEDPNTVCLEFMPVPGDAFTYYIYPYYMSPNSPGGGLTVWGVILSEEEALNSEIENETRNKRKLVEPTNGTIQLFWDVQPDPYALTVSRYTHQAPVTLDVIGNGTGKGIMNGDLGYVINLKRVKENNASFGKEYVDYADFSASLDALPVGFSWNKEVLDAINAGNISARDREIYAGDTKIATFVCLSTEISLTNLRADLNEDEQNVKFHWRATNLLNKGTQDDKEIPDVDVCFWVRKEALTIDTREFNEAYAEYADEAKTVRNKIEIKLDVEAIIHYAHGSLDDQPKADCVWNVNAGRTALGFGRNVDYPTYFGESFCETITLSNSGTRDWLAGNVGEQYVIETLHSAMYITPENMEEMFKAEYGKSLTVEIKKATLVRNWQSVTGTDGETTAWLHPGNSNLDASDHTLHVKRKDSTVEGKTITEYTVTSETGKDYTGTSVAEALQKAGYGVTADDSYTCRWVLNKVGVPCTVCESCKREEPCEEPRPCMECNSCKNSKPCEKTIGCLVRAGDVKSFTILTNVKDTFQLLNLRDCNGQYYQEKEKVSYTARFYAASLSGGSIGAWTFDDYVFRETSISKRIEKSGEILASGFDVEHNDVLDHYIDLTHYGMGSYYNLPLRDELYGSQYLLVPADKNPGHPQLSGLTANDEGYYILPPGEYENVVVGVDDEGNWLNAATVTVTRLNEEQNVGENICYGGVHIEVKWYFPEIRGGNYIKTIRYQTQVKLKPEASGTTDDVLGISTNAAYSIGSVTWANDREGSRLYTTMWGGGSFIEHDKDIVLEMGETYEQDRVADYSVVKAGEQVTYRLTLHSTSEAEAVMSGNGIADNLPDTFGKFDWSEADIALTKVEVEQGKQITHTGLQDWFLGTEYYGAMQGESGQYILWPEESSITFTEPGNIYLYFTLTYPDGSTWNSYADAVHGNRIDNTFYAYSYPSTVEHELGEVGEVILQKGVAGNYFVTWRLYPSNSRQFYNDPDSVGRRILYYVTLYNGGNKRLYLNDMQDKLPEGCTYTGNIFANNLVGNVLPVNSAATIGATNLGNYPLADFVDFEDVTFRSVTVTGTGGDGRVTFTFSEGGGDYPISYDQRRGQYYLNRNEAIVFGYLVSVDAINKANRDETNTIAMAYEDYQDAGVKIVETEALPIKAGYSEYFSDYCDGDRQVMETQEVQKNFGFAEGDEKQWLVSQVSPKLGKIGPGVTKYTDSYIVEGTNDRLAYSNRVGTGDTVTWRIRLHNTGTRSMTGYTLTDILPAPYSFEGDVTYDLYANQGISVRSGTLCTIPVRQGGEEVLTVNGKTITFGSENGTDFGHYSIGLNRENGSESLTIQFEDVNMAIPEGGYMDVYISARVPITEYTYRTYINQAVLKPSFNPDFDARSVMHGSIVYKDGKAVAVKNEALVTVSTDDVTSSDKQAITKAKADGTVVSTNNERHAITLANPEDLITYTLTVNNDTKRAMTKLVLIDTLPQPGDTSPFDENVPRDSEFTVALAESPNFKVCVTPENGIPTEIPYKVQFRNNSDIDKLGESDWKGLNPEAWKATATEARAVRIIIEDDSGTLIPAGSKITVSFDAKATGDVKPGQTAWNSFGYHYKLKDVQTELEAMPLAAGVTIPQKLKLQKKLTAPDGNPVRASDDATFSFLLYEGTALNTSEDLKEALENAGRLYMQFDVPVKKGQTESDVVPLDWTWTWTTGGAYTIAELPAGEGYQIQSVGGSEGNSYTFQYDPSGMKVIECVNVLEHWSIHVKKTNERRSVLPGAVFALYSSIQTDQIDVPAEYGTLGILEIIDKDTGRWYLARVAETGRDGLIQWKELLRDSYLLVEVKAPDGYMLSTPEGQLVYRSGMDGLVKELTVVNCSGYKLPETGGMGTMLYSISGGMLTTAAGYALGKKKRRQK